MRLLSVCIGVRGRIALPWEGAPPQGGGVLSLLPRCVQSLASAVRDRPALPEMELVIAHWPVPGEPHLETWLPEAAGAMNWRVTHPAVAYNRGVGRNQAALAAAGDVLFFLDADMLVPAGLIERGLHWIGRGKVFFPRYRRFVGPEEGRHKLEHGAGNVFLTREQFEQCGGWPELAGWGFEDRDFWRYWLGKKRVVRETPPGFLHQWHPLAPDHKSRRPEVPDSMAKARRDPEWAASPD